MSDPTNRRDPLAPCSDHGCILRTEPSRGMGTNGGCRCLRGSLIEVRQIARRLAADRRRLAEELLRARAVLHAADELADAVRDCDALDMHEDDPSHRDGVRAVYAATRRYHAATRQHRAAERREEPSR